MSECDPGVYVAGWKEVTNCDPGVYVAGWREVTNSYRLLSDVHTHMPWYTHAYICYTYM